MQVTVPLVQREQELARLESALDGAGGGGLPAVVGPAGQGKTSLLHAAAELAAATGLRTVRAQASALEQPFAFGVVRQLLEDPGIRDEVRALIEAGPARAAATILGGAHGPPEEAAVVMAAWLAVAEAAEERPLAVLVDDLHWADRSSLVWLAYAARRAGTVPLALVATARPEPDPVLEAVLAEARARIEPAPLDAAAVARLIGDEATPAFAEACRSATGGNPLYLTELLRVARQEGLGSDERAAARVRALGPDGVARSVIARCHAVGPDAIAFAEAIAVLDESATLRHAAELAGITTERAAQITDALVHSGVLRAEPPPAFRHAILRGAVLKRLGWARRSSLHAHAARILADGGAPPERVAAHLLESPPAGEAAHARQLVRAAAEQAARGAAPEAVRLLRRALEEPPAPEERLGLELELAEREVGVGDPGGLERLERLLREPHLDDAERLRALFALIPARRARLDLAAEREAAEAAQQLAEGLGLEARVMARMWTAAQMGPIRTGLLHDLADELAGDTGWLAQSVRASIAAMPEAVETAAQLRASMAAVVPGNLDWVEREPPGSFLAASVVIITIFATEDPELTDLVLARMRERGRATGSRLDAAVADIHESYASYALGELRRAEALATTVLDQFAGLGSLAVWGARHVLGRTLIARGDLGRAAATIAQLPDRMPRIGHLRSLLHLARGEWQTALDEATRPDPFEDYPSAYAIAPWRLPAAQALRGLGRDEDAEALAREAEAIARAWGAAGLLGATLRVLAEVLETPEAALPMLEEAVTVLRGSPNRLELAAALVALGDALRRSGRRTDSREPLREGLDHAIHCGAEPLAERAREALRLSGGRVRRELRSGLDSLTAGERRVAELAAQGMTNPQIAQTLYITRKTVEANLSSVYRKLDVSGRDSLASALSPITARDLAPR